MYSTHFGFMLRQRIYGASHVGNWYFFGNKIYVCSHVSTHVNLFSDSQKSALLWLYIVNVWGHWFLRISARREALSLLAGRRSVFLIASGFQTITDISDSSWLSQYSPWNAGRCMLQEGESCQTDPPPPAGQNAVPMAPGETWCNELLDWSGRVNEVPMLKITCYSRDFASLGVPCNDKGKAWGVCSLEDGASKPKLPSLGFE